MQLHSVTQSILVQLHSRMHNTTQVHTVVHDEPLRPRAQMNDACPRRLHSAAHSALAQQHSGYASVGEGEQHVGICHSNNQQHLPLHGPETGNAAGMPSAQHGTVQSDTHAMMQHGTHSSALQVCRRLPLPFSLAVYAMLSTVQARRNT
jgi:hypothetical protein